MEIKQEPDDLFSREQEIDIQEHFFPDEIVTEYWNTYKNNTQISNLIKQENCTDNHLLLQTCINPKSKTYPIIIGAGVKCNPVKINDIKQSRKGHSLNRKFIKTQNHSYGIIICAICGYLYTKHTEYLNHYSVHHSLRKKKICKNQFNRRNTSNLTNLNEDVKYDIEIVENDPKGELEENRNCTQYDGSDNYKPYSHEIVENAQLSCKKQFKCEICLKSFTQKGNFTVHLRYHTGELFRCEICAKAFSLKSNLVMHLRCHTGEKPFKCEICMKSFSQKGSLNFHLRFHTGEKPFKCDICLKMFNRKVALISHTSCHTSKKPFKCEICSKSFTTNYCLKLHMRSHTGEKPFTCDICSKTFTRKTALIPHMRCHTGEKPHQCEICLKFFSRKKTLNVHVRSHTAENLLKCEICSKSFTTNNRLKLHIRCHTGEKPFKCDICLKYFTQKGTLRVQYALSHWRKAIQM